MSIINLNSGGTRQDITFISGLDVSWIFQNKPGGSNAPLPEDTCATLIFEGSLHDNTGRINGLPLHVMSNNWRQFLGTGFGIPKPPINQYPAWSYRWGYVTESSADNVAGYSPMRLWTKYNVPPVRIVELPNVTKTGGFEVQGSFSLANIYLKTDDTTDLSSLYTFSIDTNTGTIRLDLTALGTQNNTMWSPTNHPLGSTIANRWDSYGLPYPVGIPFKYELLLKINGSYRVGAFGTVTISPRWTSMSNQTTTVGCDL